MIIKVENLTKDFKVSEKSSNSFRLMNVLHPGRKSIKRVVDSIDFTIERGEFIGYIGPNGAGKSTTIKMLTGILVPSAGKIEIMGYQPHLNRKKHAKNIGVVFGQKTQLWWDLPLIESFKLLGSIYNLSKTKYNHNLTMFTDILEMSEFLHTPVRQLSLGQRMRADIAASMLHEPEILFLDEPTIGLDIIAKEKIQKFLYELNREKSTTIILTTHNLDDIEKLCNRVIFIDHGKILFDDSTDVMIKNYGSDRYLVVEASNMNFDLNALSCEASINDDKLWLRIWDNKAIPEMIRQLNELTQIHNIFINEPKIESIVKNIYSTNIEKVTL